MRTWSSWLRRNTFRNSTINKIRKVAAELTYDAVHVISHGPFTAALCDEKYRKGKALWVSFHDHYTTTTTTLEETRDLWNKADRRLMISKELGEEYLRLFGDKDFETITDGVSEEELSAPNTVVPPTVTIYFAGLLHLQYLPLFEVLADALHLLSQQGFSFTLVLRGTQHVSFLENKAFKTEYRRDFISDKEIKEELDSATILYLPIQFMVSDFYLYSLSTKMISYLGGAGSILYHGPSESAACNLLKKTNSGICCTSLDVNELAESIKQVLNDKGNVSANAKVLAQKEFSLRKIQQRFWQESPA